MLLLLLLQELLRLLVGCIHGVLPWLLLLLMQSSRGTAEGFRNRTNEDSSSAAQTKPGACSSPAAATAVVVVVVVVVVVAGRASGWGVAAAGSCAAFCVVQISSSLCWLAACTPRHGNGCVLYDVAMEVLVWPCDKAASAICQTQGTGRGAPTCRGRTKKQGGGTKQRSLVAVHLLSL